MPLAMRPLRDQMAHCRRTTVQPSALTRSPRRSRGLMPCERLVSGSTSNEIASCQATLARSFRYFVFERVFGALKDTLSNYPLITPAAGARRYKGDGQKHKPHGSACVLRGVKFVFGCFDRVCAVGRGRGYCSSSGAASAGAVVSSVASLPREVAAATSLGSEATDDTTAPAEAAPEEEQ